METNYAIEYRRGDVITDYKTPRSRATKGKSMKKTIKVTKNYEQFSYVKGNRGGL